jgi:aminoglycoside phosphotransferase (APT) family kinase protein
MQSDLPEWSPALARHLAEATGRDTEVVGVRALAGGACQDNFRVDVTVEGQPSRFALRSDARASLPGSIGRAEERRVIDLAVASGVPTPAVRHEVPDLLRPGATALLMDWVDGVAIAARVLRDPALEAARAALPEQLARALVAIHRAPVTPGVLDVPHSATSGRAATEAMLSFSRTTLDTLPEPKPGLELVFRWLEAHAPPDRPPVLCHGDFRMGNFMVGAGSPPGSPGLVALVDWEFAHWGSPADDLGWLCVRDWRFGKLDRAAGGLVPRARFVEAYLAAGGLPVTEEELEWWEIAGNLRWAAGAHWQAQRVLQGHEQDLELLAIGRRAAEIEFEALRRVRRRVETTPIRG